MSKAELSIIIVNWNSKYYLQKCLYSIMKDERRPALEIIVVDNASYDGCDQILADEFEDVYFVQSEHNIGFAGANNLGSQHSKAEYLLFLNPDTEVGPGALRTMLENLKKLSKAGVVGAHLLNKDGSVQKSCIRTFPTLLNQLLETETLIGWFPRSRLWGMAPLYDQPEKPVEVDAISGACIMIKKSVFNCVDKFSADYFMYSEDIDLCHKVRKAGCKNYYIPTAVIVHYGGASSSQSSANTFSSVMMLESRLRFFRKTQSWWYCHLYRLAMCSASIFRIGLVLLMWPIHDFCCSEGTPKTVLEKWIARLRWTLGGEKWVKNFYGRNRGGIRFI